MKRFFSDLTKTVFSLVCFVCLTMVGHAADRIRIHHGPYLQNVKETEATFVWMASKPSVGWVELAPDDGSNYYNKERRKYFDTTNGVKNTSLLHVVKVSGLEPGTAYRYRVYATEVLEHKGVEVIYGKTAALDVYTARPPVFRTHDATKPETSFAIINDIHGRTADIPALLNAVHCQQKDMVIFNGDMLTQLRSEEELFSGFMDASVDLFAKQVPMYYARGNHETRGLFATSFQHYFSPKEPHLYYMFRQGPVCFLVLDTGEDKPDTDIEYSGITDYDNYRNEQAEWLKEAVRTPEFRDAKFRIVIAHMPPQPVKGLWHGPQEVLDKFVPILNEAGIDAMLCGHLHRYLHCKPDSQVRFPVVVNAHNTVIDGQTSGDRLQLEIRDTQGTLVDKILLERH